MAYKLSPSSLSLLKDCPRCFWLHFRKGIKRPRRAFPSLPTGMDRIFKKQFDSSADRGMLPPELAQLENLSPFQDKELLKIWRNNLKGIEWKDADDNLFRGAVDSIFQMGKKLVVIDCKTRGFDIKENTHENYRDQMDIYNWLLRKNGYETESYSVLLFYYPDKINENGNVLFRHKLVKIKTSIQNAERLVHKTIHVLDGDMPQSSEHCEFCRWAKDISPLRN